MIQEHAAEYSPDLRRWRTEIPNMVVDDPELGPYELALYVFYKRIAGDAGLCFKSRDQIAAETGMGTTKLMEARAKLVELGYITVDENPPQRTEVRIVSIWERNFDRYRSTRRETADTHRSTAGNPPPRGAEEVTLEELTLEEVQSSSARARDHDSVFRELAKTVEELCGLSTLGPRITDQIAAWMPVLEVEDVTRIRKEAERVIEHDPTRRGNRWRLIQAIAGRAFAERQAGRDPWAATAGAADTGVGGGGAAGQRSQPGANGRGRVGAGNQGGNGTDRRGIPLPGLAAFVEQQAQGSDAEHGDTHRPAD